MIASAAIARKRRLASSNSTCSSDEPQELVDLSKRACANAESLLERSDQILECFVVAEFGFPERRELVGTL